MYINFQQNLVKNRAQKFIFNYQYMYYFFLMYYSDMYHRMNYFYINFNQNCVGRKYICVSRRNERDLTYGKSKLSFVLHVVDDILPIILIQNLAI